MSRRLRVLVIAEAANPEWVSVPLVGWSMAHALREVADVHIVTQVRNRDAILRTGLVEGTDFSVIDTERLAGPVYRLASLLRGGSGKGWTLMTAAASLTYPYFERLVWRRFGTAIRQGRFDLVHRITPLSPTAPSPVAQRCRKHGVPFILGPLNGGLPWPPGYGDERRKEREWLSYVRGLYRLLPNRGATLRAASAILVGSRHTAADLPSEVRDRVIYMPENGVDPARFAQAASPAAGDGPLRLCFIGRLVPYKGPDMAIEAAMPLLRAGRATLEIVGDGPMRSELETLARSTGIADGVTFHGWVPHDQVGSVAARCHALLFPSVREFGGGAVLEAMAAGLTPIVVDYGGPGELVALAGHGVAVPIAPRTDLIRSLSVALDRLAADPDLRTRTGAAVRAWAFERLAWPAKARAMADIYDWTVGNRMHRPEPFGAI